MEFCAQGHASTFEIPGFLILSIFTLVFVVLLVLAHGGVRIVFGAQRTLETHNGVKHLNGGLVRVPASSQFFLAFGPR